MFKLFCSNLPSLKFILIDEPTAYRSKKYFPKSVKKALLKNKDFSENIKPVEARVKQKQYSNSWLLVLRKALEQIKRGKFVSCFGLVLGVNNSGKIAKRGSIAKQRSKLAKAILMRCALIAMRFSFYLANSCTHIQISRASGKVIMATIKKMLGLFCQTLTIIYLKISKFILPGNLKFKVESHHGEGKDYVYSTN